jgi:hypothetical protein
MGEHPQPKRPASLRFFCRVARELQHATGGGCTFVLRVGVAGRLGTPTTNPIAKQNPRSPDCCTGRGFSLGVLLGYRGAEGKETQERNPGGVFIRAHKKSTRQLFFMRRNVGDSRSGKKSAANAARRLEFHKSRNLILTRGGLPGVRAKHTIGGSKHLPK